METKKKPPCEFGAKCYRKNPRHFESYSHPHKANEPTSDTEIKNEPKRSPRTRMKQTVLTFPTKREFSSEPKIQSSDKNKKNVKTEKKEEKKNEGNLNRKRKASGSEKDKPKVRIKNNRAKTSSCFKGNDSSSEVADSSDTSGLDSGTVQSTSWVFLKNQSSESEDTLNLSSLKDKTAEEKIKALFLVDMPLDFYSFYNFCKSIDESSPPKALEISGLKLVGPFDILSGKMNYVIDKDLFLTHWRFYYDPPEFQTILATTSGFHFGYWRDDPKENPVFVASTNSDKGCTFKIEAENIFGTVFQYLNEFEKTCDPFKKVKIKNLQNSLSEWAKENEFTLNTKTSKMTERQKKVVSKTFHGAGIVVPVEPKSDVGYRPLIETNANLKKICKLIMDANDENERELMWENLQPLITAANIANDECDFGNSLELGIDLFCMGSPTFHETVEHLLSTAYSLLGRPEFESIIKAHLKLRRKELRALIFILKMFFNQIYIKMYYGNRMNQDVGLILKCTGNPSITW